MGYRAPENSRCLAPTRAVSLLLRPRRGPGVAEGHLLKLAECSDAACDCGVTTRALIEVGGLTSDLADEAATRELVDGERVRLLEWTYANGLRLGGEQRG